MRRWVCSFVGMVIVSISFAQAASTDSIKTQFNKVYSLALDGDARSALQQLSVIDSSKMDSSQRQFKTQFEARFGHANDKSQYIDSSRSVIAGLLKLYSNYWREGLLDTAHQSDTAFMADLLSFLSASYPTAHIVEDGIDNYLKAYVASKGLHTTGFGRTGKFFDLLVWKNQKDTVYHFSLQGEHTSAPIEFMTQFVTLGWEQYATMGRYYPGGWATKEKLYCVRDAYDLNSEDFLISYLAHESRHFADYKLFPKLGSADLEYRAKLTELSLAKTTLYELIGFFTSNANYSSGNGHSVADYCVIRDLSKRVFNISFQQDASKWNQVSVATIHAAALAVLKGNTQALKKAGSDVEHFIKQ